MPSYQKQKKRYPGLARRATRAARRETAPARAQAQKEKAIARRQGGRAAATARRTYGRQARAELSMAQNVGGNVANAGLVRRQLAAGAEQVQGYGQGMAALAQRAARRDISAINRQMPSAEESAAEQLASMVAERRQAEKERKSTMRTARGELDFLISRIPDQQILHRQDVRDELAADIASTEGIDLTPAEARALVERRYGRIYNRLPAPRDITINAALNSGRR